MQQLFLDPLRFEFMQRAMLAAMLVGIISGVMGTYVVTRGMAFFGDALAHSVLPGVAAVFITGNTAPGALLLGGLVAGVLSALGIGILSQGRRLGEDTAIGIVFAGMLALGIALISSTRSYAVDLAHILIGNIQAVQGEDIVLMLIAGGAVLLFVVALYKELLVISFDPTLAKNLHLPAEGLRLALLVALAVTVVIGVQVAGVALVSALLVTPAATARFFAKRLHVMMIVAAFLGALSGVGGMYLSWHLSIAPSAAIVLLATGLFILAFLFSPRGGFIPSLLGRNSDIV